MPILNKLIVIEVLLLNTTAVLYEAIVINVRLQYKVHAVMSDRANHGCRFTSRI